MDEQNQQQALPPQQPPLPPQNVNSMPPPANPNPPHYQNWLKWVLIYFIIAVLIYGGIYYYLATQQKKSSLYSTNSPSPTIIPSPTPDPTANWKTYINNRRGYSFKYSSSYKVVEKEDSFDSFESVVLEKDVEVAEGGGFGGGDALKKGVTIYFSIIPNKDISETSLQGEFGTDITIKQLLLDNKKAVQIELNNSKSGPFIFYNYGGEVLKIGLMVGFENTNGEYQSYLSGFNQILSTFKFTQ